MKLAEELLKAHNISEASESEVIGKTKSGKDVHITFSHSAHSSFTKQDHEDAARINRGKFSLKNKSQLNDKYRHNEKMHSSAAKESDKKPAADDRDAKLKRTFDDIERQFGKKSEGLINEDLLAKYEMALKILERKPKAVQAEMFRTGLKNLVNVVEDVPSVRADLKQFAAEFLDMVRKGASKEELDGIDMEEELDQDKQDKIKANNDKMTDLKKDGGNQEEIDKLEDENDKLNGGNDTAKDVNEDKHSQVDAIDKKLAKIKKDMDALHTRMDNFRKNDKPELAKELEDDTAKLIKQKHDLKEKKRKLLAAMAMGESVKFSNKVGFSDDMKQYAEYLISKNYDNKKVASFMVQKYGKESGHGALEFMSLIDDIKKKNKSNEDYLDQFMDKKSEGLASQVLEAHGISEDTEHDLKSDILDIGSDISDVGHEIGELEDKKAKAEGPAKEAIEKKIEALHKKQADLRAKKKQLKDRLDRLP